MMETAPGSGSDRNAILASFGASGGVADELLVYNENGFDPGRFGSLPQLPLEDEKHLEVWLEYELECAESGTLRTLSRHFVQLSFPVEEGISQTDTYRAATRKGEWPHSPVSPSFEAPQEIRLSIHPTLAGRVPIIIAGRRNDFETLVRVFSGRNEPVKVPPSMGACIVTGFNNWDRIRRIRKAWEEQNPGAGESGWSEEFRKIIPDKSLYQDRFIILSSGPYSGVPAAELGLEDGVWHEQSVRIRSEHEATHYFTYRLLGAMRNNLIDEIMADYAGLVATRGRYESSFALRFLGLEEYPAYRPGGRLENYRGTPALSDEAFGVLQALVFSAVNNLQRFDESLSTDSRTSESRAQIILALAELTLEELAADSAVERLRIMTGFSEAEMSEGLSLKLKNQQFEMDRLLVAFEEFSEGNDIPAEARSTFHMALDEMVSNVIKYGYDDDLEHEIEVKLTVEDGVLSAEIIDDGHEFDPLTREDPDTSLGIDERSIGGLGVHLVKQMTDEQIYTRREGRNHLVLRKKLRV